jgi:hypothetical protein
MFGLLPWLAVKPALSRQRLGLRQPSAAFKFLRAAKAPEGWRTPKPCGISYGHFMMRELSFHPLSLRFSRFSKNLPSAME